MSLGIRYRTPRHCLPNLGEKWYVLEEIFGLISRSLPEYKGDITYMGTCEKQKRSIFDSSIENEH